MKKSPAVRGTPSTVAEALPGTVPLAFFLGGPFSPAEGAWQRSIAELLRLLSEHGSEAESVGALLGPLGRAGFDPAQPGRAGLAPGAGLALFHAEEALGVAAAVRSPKVFREVLRKTVAPRRLRALKVPGAVEAGWGAMEDEWDIAFARRPPWVYVLVGPEVRKSAAAQLEALVRGEARGSLAAAPAFRQAVRSGGLQGDVALWVGEEGLSLAGPDPEVWREMLDRWSGVAGRAGSMLDAMFHLRGGVLGGCLGPQEAKVEGLMLAEGTWLRALETTVGQGSQCVIGPRALARHCPVWALSVLDWTLFARTVPVVAGAIDRIAGPWAELLRRPGGQGRANGVIAAGLCGARPLAGGAGAVAETDLLEAVDAFLVLELLGQNLPAQLAGRMVDVVGDVMRDGMRRLRRGEREERTSVVLAGHRFYVAVRRGAMILATTRAALEEARSMLESNRAEALPPGFVLGGAWEPQRVLGMMGAGAGGEEWEGMRQELLREVRRLGAARFEVRQVPGGLRATFRQALLPA